MYVIRRAQAAELDQSFWERAVDEWTVQLRCSEAETLSRLSDQQLREMVHKDLCEGRRLGFEDYEELWWYIRLRHRLANVGSSSLYLGVIVGVLSNCEWSARKRIAFIDRHVFRIP